MISIVVPARNEEDNLRRLLRSVEEQEFEDYEVVVVDGGSTDGTREVAEEYGATVIEGPLKGPAVARNMGWRESKGDYIYFMDADWFFDGEVLQKVEAEFDEETDIVHVNAKHYTTNWISKTISAENSFGSTSYVIEKLNGVIRGVRNVFRA